MNIHIISFFTESIKKGLPVILPLFLLYIVSACDNVNSIHQKYFDEGEDIYTGVVDSLKAYAGYEKVRFTWEVNGDPRIVSTIIYWNQRADSIVIDVNRTQSGRIPITYDLTNMEEGNYIFEFITRDDEGHFSLSKELTVLIYGDSYVQTLRNRNVSSITKQTDGSRLIRWDAIASNAIQYVTVIYKIGDVEQSIQVENGETQTILKGLDTGDKIRIFTTYLPDGALETLDSPVREYIIP